MSHLLPMSNRSDLSSAQESVEKAESIAVYTVVEVAKLLKLSRGSAYESVRSGEIPAMKIGHRWLIPKRRFHAWLDGTEI